MWKDIEKIYFITWKLVNVALRSCAPLSRTVTGTRITFKAANNGGEGGNRISRTADSAHPFGAKFPLSSVSLNASPPQWGPQRSPAPKAFLVHFESRKYFGWQPSRENQNVHLKFLKRRDRHFWVHYVWGPINTSGTRVMCMYGKGAVGPSPGHTYVPATSISTNTRILAIVCCVDEHRQIRICTRRMGTVFRWENSPTGHLTVLVSLIC